VLRNGNPQPPDSFQKGRKNRSTCEVARVTCSSVEMSAEEALIDPAVFSARERAPPIGELKHARRCLCGHDLDHSWIRQSVTFVDRVGEVVLPRVFWITRPEDGIYPSGRKDGVGVLARPLADNRDLDTGLGCGDRSPEAGAARADDENAGDIGPNRGGHGCLL
jgi:hypothetical protein